MILKSKEYSHQLKALKSQGYDGFSSIYIKRLKDDIARPLSILINQSMSSGYFPDSLKIAKVIPIYKAKNRDDFNNYRPISLLSVLSKILEKVIHEDSSIPKW